MRLSNHCLRGMGWPVGGRQVAGKVTGKVAGKVADGNIIHFIDLIRGRR